MLWFGLAAPLLACVLGLLARHGRRGQGMRVPADLRAFVRRLEQELAARHPDVRLAGILPGRFTAILALRGQEIPVGLHPLLRQTRAYPQAFTEILDRLVRELEETALGDLEDHEFGEVAADILPQVRSRAWLESAAPRFGDAALVHRAFGEDLVICYVIDEPFSLVFVCQAHLRRWGRTEEDLFHLATANLHRRAACELPLTAAEPEAVFWHTCDGYDAARVLLLDPEAAEGRLVAMPERDLLWIGSGKEDRHELAASAERIHRAATHPISPRLYRLQEGGLVAVNEGGRGR